MNRSVVIMTIQSLARKSLVKVGVRMKRGILEIWAKKNPTGAPRGDPELAIELRMTEDLTDRRLLNVPEAEKQP